MDVLLYCTEEQARRVAANYLLHGQSKPFHLVKLTTRDRVLLREANQPPRDSALTFGNLVSGVFSNATISSNYYASMPWLYSTNGSGNTYTYAI